MQLSPRRLVALAVPLAVGLVAAGGVSPAAAAKAKPAAKPQAVSAQGVIVARQGRAVRILASSLTVNRRTTTGRLVTLTMPAPQKRTAPALRVGDVLSVNGKGTTAGTSANLAVALTSTAQVTEAPSAAQVFVGTVGAVGLAGGVVGVDLSEEVAPFPAGDDDPDGGSALTVDVSAATVSLDGTASSAASLAPRQTVVVLGENDGAVVAAAAVYAWSDPQDTVQGEVTAVDGTLVTLDDDQDVDLAVDGAPVPLLLNGNRGRDSADLSEGDTLLVVGQDTADGFVASVAFAFNGNDEGPCGTNDD